MKKLIDDRQVELDAYKNETIRIVSGEGTEGTSEIYEGKRTVLALTRRLNKERCEGERWAFATIGSGENRRKLSWTVLDVNVDFIEPKKS